ncbi:IPT/TIG domain-containing protein [Cecembia lonarensis]|uniref:IPT/TIG domain protein n=1 Tax=Cecembia lonarensis (strain CCUG 58316 / KCTC 22772 / LW9) TaxID=1225176 RepID=K1LCU9_CECL9|nr:IPT/TIG domain-containing protein [Cecembia lonarensis]EKB50032.1 IPT/TIG domain protein [Cecembia lonarensis LW9]
MKVRIVVALSCLSLLAGIFFSCEEDLDFNPAIVTEDVIFASAERFRISGRIITNQRIDASDHGFQIADNPQFNQPIIVSLGERENPGRFLGEVDGLNLNTNYYIKAYIEIGGQSLFGNTIEASTLSPAILSFTPQTAPAGDIVTINGKNFTSDTEVFFGDLKADVIDISFESSIRVRVPSGGDIPTVSIRVVNQNLEIVSETSFRYILGRYTLIAEFPSTVRVFDGISLQEGDVFYLGKGSNTGQSLNEKMWRYQVGDVNWQEIDLLEENKWNAFSSSRYFGGGFLGVNVSSPNTRTFFRLQNGIITQLADLPFNVSDAVAFEISGKLYLAGGSLGNVIRKYDPTTGNWSTAGNTPFLVSSSTLSFTFENKQYFVNPEDSQILAYNPVLENWEGITLFPGTLGAGKGVATVVGNKAYLGLGTGTAQLWEYDFNNGIWTPKINFNGISLARTEGVYVHDGKIYFVRSPQGQFPGIRSEFWVFDPDRF